jgi:hypothetical protein
MLRVMLIESLHGSDVEREYTYREAKRPTHKICRGCNGTIQVGQAYWDYHGDRRYHDLCFKARGLQKLEGE